MAGCRQDYTPRMGVRVDESEVGITWVQDEAMARASHALVSDGKVWIIDPVDDPEVMERVAGLGTPVAVFQLLDREPIVPLDEGFVTDALIGNIELREVHFAYPARADAKVLRGLSMKIEAGTVVALVGPSGAGKSTIISLIERFYDVDKGAVLIDGRELAKLSGASLRRHLGLVLQEPVLFAETIRDNIAFGQPAATAADAS